MITDGALVVVCPELSVVVTKTVLRSVSLRRSQNSTTKDKKNIHGGSRFDEGRVDVDDVVVVVVVGEEVDGTEVVVVEELGGSDVVVVVEVEIVVVVELVGILLEDDDGALEDDNGALEIELGEFGAEVGGAEEPMEEDDIEEGAAAESEAEERLSVLMAFGMSESIFGTQTATSSRRGSGCR